MMASIRLSSGKFAVVDEYMYEELSKFKWQQAGNGYPCTTIWLGEGCMPRQKTIYMHRLIANATDTEEHVDHINRDILDNRTENLRLCTRAQNYVNQPARNKLGVKGVSKSGNKYSAQITINGEHLNLGSFSTVAQASERYQSVAREAWGDFVYNHK